MGHERQILSFSFSLVSERWWYFHCLTSLCKRFLQHFNSHNSINFTTSELKTGQRNTILWHPVKHGPLSFLVFLKNWFQATLLDQLLYQATFHFPSSMLGYPLQGLGSYRHSGLNTRWSNFVLLQNLAKPGIVETSLLLSLALSPR